MTEILAETYHGQVISVWQITEILQEARSPSRCRLILVVNGRDRTVEIQTKKATGGLIVPQGSRSHEARHLIDQAKQWIDKKNSDFPQI